MEGRKCREVIWGRKGSRFLQREDSPDHGERMEERGWRREDGGERMEESGEREGRRESRAYRGLHKKNISPKSHTGKKRGGNYHEFLQPAELKKRSIRIPHHSCCGAWQA